MAVETEIKLSLPARAAPRLARHPLLAGIKPLRQQLINTYYDTPELRLQGERIAVRYRKKGWQWLLTVKCATPSAGGLAQRNEWEGPGLPGEFDFSHVDDKKLRHLLESLRTELIPVFTTDFIRNAWQIEQQGGTRIELALDRGQIEANGHHEPICEVELELLDGDVAALFAAASLLQADLPLHPEVVSKAERGYRLHANAAPAPVKAPATSIDHRLTAIKAFSTVALSCLNQLQANEDGLQKSSDPEFVHQARVAIRRLRSAIRAWKPLLPAEYIDNFDPRWRILAAALGETRNHDVFISEILPSLTEAFLAALKSTVCRVTHFVGARPAEGAPAAHSRRPNTRACCWSLRQQRWPCPRAPSRNSNPLPAAALANAPGASANSPPQYTRRMPLPGIAFA